MSGYTDAHSIYWNTVVVIVVSAVTPIPSCLIICVHYISQNTEAKRFAPSKSALPSTSEFSIGPLHD